MKAYKMIGGQVVPGEYVTASGSVYIVKQGKNGFDVSKQGNPDPIVTGTNNIHISKDGSLVVGVGDQTMVTSTIKEFPEGYKPMESGGGILATYDQLIKRIDVLREQVTSSQGAGKDEVMKFITELKMIDNDHYSLPHAESTAETMKGFDLQNKVMALKSKLKSMYETEQGQEMPQTNLEKLATGAEQKLVSKIAKRLDTEMDEASKKKPQPSAAEDNRM